MMTRASKHSKRGAGPDAQGAASVDDHERAADETCDHPRVRQDVPAIFLSHSGKQKPFVENLYNELQKANHTAFFDKHTLRTGTPFPAEIDQAARGCTIGVIVLSDDFLTSKWPMRELELLVMQRGPNACVIPLFYKLSTSQLKSPENLSKWQRRWKKMDPKIVNQWKQAVEKLDSFSGVEFIAGSSEVTYIRTVVDQICKLLPSPILYDLSPIKGLERLSQVVAAQFQGVCMLGLHGVGGLGKTTMCQIMANFYWSEYRGKSCVIEFPSNGDDKEIVQRCKKALKRLANLNKEHVLDKVDAFEEVVQLMRENLSRYDVFLAVDNVWESCREKAERILSVDFSMNSKILLTSRSEQVLKNLLKGYRNTHVGPLPSPDHEEAFEIFRENFRQVVDLQSLVDKNQLDSVLERCRFSGSYHALALKALSQYVKRACTPGNIEDCLDVVLKEISNNKEGLQTVEDLIMLNYGNLQDNKQRMFLDIVAVLMSWAGPSDMCDREVSYAAALQWLSFLYKEYSERMIRNLIYELALEGLIQLEEGNEGSEMMITVHDLYYDLAQREATSSYRFWMNGSITSLEKIEWQRLERVIIKRGQKWDAFEEIFEQWQQRLGRVIIKRGQKCDASFVEKLQQQECPKLQVLCGRGMHFEGEIDISLMPSLCVLKLEGGTLGSIKNWSAATRLAIVDLESLKCTRPLKPVPSLPCLEELHIERVEVEGPPDLQGCQRMKELVLSEASVFRKEGSGKHLEPCFKSLTNMRNLEIWHYSSMSGVFNISALVNLQHLNMVCCRIQNIEGLDALTKLQSLSVSSSNLKKVPDLSGLTCLERLWLYKNESMEEVGRLSPALQCLQIEQCTALKKVPDLSALTCLETLRLYKNESMEEVGRLSPALEYLDIEQCPALKKVPDLSGLTCLQQLTLFSSEPMEEVGVLSPTHWKVVDLSGLTCLKSLELISYGSAFERDVEVMVGENVRTTLEVLTVRHVSESWLRVIGELKKLHELNWWENPTTRAICEHLWYVTRLRGVQLRRKYPGNQFVSCDCERGFFRLCNY